jgi:hypothetical protein
MRLLSMKKRLADSAQTSQIETFAPQQRVVLLGASNLSIMFPTIVETARAMFAEPLEMYVAKGFGRSYGQQSKFFGKKFPGILQSGLWDAMGYARALPTVAIVADVGNDLAYEAPVRTILQWVEQTLDRLAGLRAQVVLNDLPLASLRTVGAVRYRVLREVLFPSCRLSRDEMLRRAEQLSDALRRIAQEREIPIFSGEKQFYGFDPIHPRRAASGEIWQRMLGAVAPSQERSRLVRPSAVAALRLHQLKPQAWQHLGLQRRAAQPNGRLADGATIALY